MSLWVYESKSLWVYESMSLHYGHKLSYSLVFEAADLYYQWNSLNITSTTATVTLPLQPQLHFQYSHSYTSNTATVTLPIQQQLHIHYKHSNTSNKATVTLPLQQQSHFHYIQSKTSTTATVSWSYFNYCNCFTYNTFMVTLTPKPWLNTTINLAYYL